MVSPAGFEPATLRLGILRSIQLSYEPSELLNTKTLQISHYLICVW